MMTQTGMLRPKLTNRSLRKTMVVPKAVTPFKIPTTFHWNAVLLFATFFMTYLTFVKEGGLYYNEWHNWRALAYLLAMKIYYPLLCVNLIGILFLVRQYPAPRKSSKILFMTTLVFIVNVGLFSANNVINLIDGKPLHSPHRGIGW